MRSLNSENFERKSPPKTESVIPAAKKMKFETVARNFSNPMHSSPAPVRVLSSYVNPLVIEKKHPLVKVRRSRGYTGGYQALISTFLIGF